MRFGTLRICALSLSLASAGLAQGRNARFIAPTDVNVVTSIEEGSGSSPSQIIYVQNLSTVRIIVYSVTLRECENIRQSCLPTRLNLRLRPSGREMMLRVEPRNPNAGFTFRYSFGWRADSSDVEAMRVLAENGMSTAKLKLEAHDEAVAERRAAVGVQDITLDDSALVALGPQVARLRIEPDSVVLRVGQIYLVRRVRVMALDAGGELLGRASAYSWRVMKGVVSVQADTIVAQQPGRIMAEFRLRSPNERLTAQLPFPTA